LLCRIARTSIVGEYEIAPAGPDHRCFFVEACLLEEYGRVDLAECAAMDFGALIQTAGIGFQNINILAIV